MVSAGPLPRIGLCPGDALGIGPEVLAAAAAGAADAARLVWIGEASLLDRAATLRRVEVGHVDPVDVDPSSDPRFPTLPQVLSVATGVRLCREGALDAIVTGPWHKGRLLGAGFPYAGHTEYLAERCGLEPDSAVMVFAGGELRIGLATVHIPLSEVPRRLDAGCIRRAFFGLRDTARALGLSQPRLAVLGLNPHAGEDGLLGREEIEVIRPAVAALRAEGHLVDGPIPADTAFAQHRRGRWDGLVAMYHDQGLAPLKALDFGESVNITAGLPILRTSVDHGTADDIAWTGVAEASHAEAALRMAIRLATGRRAVPPA